MALKDEELRHRLVAARELIGLDQRQMGAKLDEQGLGRTDAMRLERGRIAFTPAHLSAYTRITGLPSQWFTIGDVSALFSPALAGEDPDEALGTQADVVRALRSLLAALENVRSAMGEEAYQSVIDSIDDRGEPDDAKVEEDLIEGEDASGLVDSDEPGEQPGRKPGQSE